MSSLAKNIVLVAALGVTSAIQLETAVADVRSLKRWQNDEIIFNGCDQSYYLQGGVYEMRLNCDKHFVIKKHEDGKVFDLKSMKIEHHAEIGYMKMQRDGDLVVYSKNNEAMWYTGTYGNEGAYMDFQNDGNLVIYKDKSDGGKDVLWAAGTHTGAQDYSYYWENNDKLIDGCGPEGQKALLQHEYGHPNKGWQYKLQLNCYFPPELVIYRSEPDDILGGSIWRPKITYDLNRAGKYDWPNHLIMQADGNLVVYSDEGKAMWASDTAGNPGAFVSFHDDGNLVIYKHQAGGAQVIWESGTFHY